MDDRHARLTDAGEREHGRLLNVFFDVDQTLVHVTQHLNSLRPGAQAAIQRLKEAGHGVYVWSAGGADYVNRTVDMHGLREWVDGCFDKHPKVQPRPDVVIDDDWYLVEKYGGYLVSQYKVVDDTDSEIPDIVANLEGLGYL